MAHIFDFSHTSGNVLELTQFLKMIEVILQQLSHIILTQKKKQRKRPKQNLSKGELQTLKQLEENRRHVSIANENIGKTVILIGG